MDVEVKIKHLNIDMININYKLDLNRLNFYEPSYRYKKNFARNLQQYVRKAHSFRCGMDSTKYRDNVYVDIENIHKNLSSIGI